MKATMTILLMILTSLLLGACSNVDFAGAMAKREIPQTDQDSDEKEQDQPQPKPEEEQVCEPGQVQVVKPVKVLFVVDQSGSNLTGTNVDSTPTDPNKEFRLKVIQDFYEQHKTKAHLSWGFLSFNDHSAKAFINKGDTSLPTFSRNSNSVTDALVTFQNSQDVGRTPYKAALNMIEDLIAQDLAASSVDPDYLVAFITDGVPSDYCPGSPSQWLCPGQILDNALDSDLNRLVSLSPSRIQFGTVYYGPQDADASGRLSRMAQMGNGQFVDANVASEIALNDVITIPKPICQ